MHGSLSEIDETATKVAVQVPDQTVSESEFWFRNICRGLLGKDAGFALHSITGFEERSCYRYAAGDRKPPAYFLRALLRSPQGAQFLAAVMEGSDAEWWKDHQRQVTVVRIAEQFAVAMQSR